jgi:1,2-diacylglycerol 3-beta-glucosyltransferase
MRRDRLDASVDTGNARGEPFPARDRKRIRGARGRFIACGLIVSYAVIAWISAIWVTPARVVQLGVVGLAFILMLVARIGGRRMRGAIQRSAGDLGLTSSMPFVTVVIPARDEVAVVAAAVRDLVSQDYELAGRRRFEVLVVDDASTDGTGDLVRSIIRDHGDLARVLRRGSDIGLATRGSTLSYATRYAKGTVIAAVDADSRMSKDFLRRAMGAWARDDPEAAALQVQRRTVSSSWWLARAQDDEQLMDMCHQCWRWQTDGTAELRGNGMFIMRDRLEMLGGWDEHALTEDLDMSMRLLAAGERIALAPEAPISEQPVGSLVTLWHQRLRWAHGSLRRFLDHAPSVARAPIPLSRKLNVLGSFLVEFAVPPLLIATLVTDLGRALSGAAANWNVPLTIVLAYAWGVGALAWAGVSPDGRGPWGRAAAALRVMLFDAHWLVIVPAALVRVALGPARTRYVKTVHLPWLVQPHGRRASEPGRRSLGVEGE